MKTNVVDFRPGALDQDIVETPTFARITRLLEDCHAHKRLGVVRGAVGIGKTLAVEDFRSGHEGEVAVCTLNPTARAPLMGTKLLAEAIERDRLPLWHEISQGALYRGWSAWREVRDAVQGMRRGRVTFIVDESQHAAPNLLDVFRSIWDGGGCGLVLLGNPRLFDPRLGRMTEADFGPLLSRAHHVLDIPESTVADVDAVLGNYAVAGAESRALLHEIAKAGGLREVVAVILKAREITGATPVTLKALRAAARTTGLAGATWTRGRG